MSTEQNNAAAEFIKRKQKNLDYFKVALPRVYQIIENMSINRAELVITPGRDDLDMVVDGKSCYRGLAREYSKDEALQFLKDNPPDKPLKTFRPEWASTESRQRFATQKLQAILRASPATPENFQGYTRESNFFPSLVFLGAGLGFQIELLAQRADIVTAFVVERDPEKFALSLFTVDWASICARFQRRGRAINFVIGFEGSEGEMRNLLSAHLKSAVPLYPFLAVYYNHLADIELARIMNEVSKDLALIAANWSNYDDQMIRLKNTQFNLRRDMTYLKWRALSPTGKPLVVVGSGPSIDYRIDSLKAARDSVVVVSAGTGLRPLLVAGIKPDLHVELDPSYSIYEMNADLGPDALKDIPLLAVNEINPHVPELFGKTRFFYKSDNYIGAFLGIAGDGFSGCNPTCTNAALAIGYSIGFRKIFLFGTDYGFESLEKDHANTSIHGKSADTEFAQKLKERVSRHKHSYFRVPSVSGGEIYSRIDYYTANRSLGALLEKLERNDSSLSVFNCADGAVIEGTVWYSADQFSAAVKETEACGPADLESRLDSMESQLESDRFEGHLPELLAEMQAETQDVAKLLQKAKLKGNRDLVLLANDLKLRIANIQPRKNATGITGEQRLINQLIQGTLLRLLNYGLTHALACSDGKQRGQFTEQWRKLGLSFLGELPNHFEKVLLDSRSYEENPWSRTGIRLPEPELTECHADPQA
jgi:hypothetical protein